MPPLGLPRFPRRPGARGRNDELAASWRRPIGLGWERPYTVRYASNLDDGPQHGAPLGGFGAGCLGRGPNGQFNLWHLDGGEHWFGLLPDCQFALHERDGTGSRSQALATAPERDDSRPQAGPPLGAWSWYPASDGERASGTYSARYPLHRFDYDGVFRAEVRCEAAGITLRVPRPGLCTDNGAMVAALGSRLVRSGAAPSPLDFATTSNLPVTRRSW